MVPTRSGKDRIGTTSPHQSKKEIPKEKKKISEKAKPAKGGENS